MGACGCQPYGVLARSSEVEASSGSGRGGVVGEPDGFREFVETRSAALLRTGWLLTGSWHSAEDLVQTALAKAWPRWHAIQRRDAPEVYVRRVMLTTFLAWRNRRSWGEVPVAEVREVAAPGVAAELRLDLQRSLAGLSRQQRAVLVLRYFDDLTEAQTAAVLGCAVGTVKAHAHRALAHLRADLGDTLREEMI